MEQKHNAVGWFEIPVNDMDRAVSFYETVFGVTMERHTLGPLVMAWFPWVENGPGAAGSLVHAPEFYRPLNNGVLVYFTSPSGDLAVELARVREAGGEVLREKTLISDDVGYMALFLDTEGNRIALHSRR